MKNFVADAIAAGAFAWDIEHPKELSPHKKDFRLSGISFATETGAFYERDLTRAFQILIELFDTETEAVAWNGKYDFCLLYTSPSPRD